MDTLTIASGIASLLSLLIQIVDLFPRFARFRLAVFIFFTGIFLGSFLRAFDSSSVKLSIQITGMGIIITTIGTIVVGFLVAAAFSDKNDKRSEFYVVAAIAAVVFLLSVFFSSDNFKPVKPPEDGIGLSVTELNLLSDHALQNKDFERAIMYLQTIKNRLQNNDALPFGQLPGSEPSGDNGDKEQLEVIKEKINKIKSQEFK